VYDNNGSVKKHKDDITKDDIKDMAEMAGQNIWKKNYLEAKFSVHGTKENSVVNFTEYGRLIVGYDVYVPFTLRGLFNIKGVKENERYTYNYGLFIPHS